jgi:hypothetical protein
VSALGGDPRKNPFLVLGLARDASATEIEREGRKLLALLEAGAKKAASYATPWGPMPRTQDAVREAMAALREPRRRILHEAFVCSGAAPLTPSEPAPEPIADAFEIYGWKLPG